MQNADTVIANTQKWIRDVVIACNFCPFAAREFKRKTIHYEVMEPASLSETMAGLLKSCRLLDSNDSIETLFLILPGSCAGFSDYLNLVTAAEKLLRLNRYEGVYQVASFHPSYLFAGSDENDPANYTNRSPYPMLHLLREESLSRAIAAHGHTEDIPQTNISFARQKGLKYMQLLKASCV